MKLKVVLLALLAMLVVPAHAEGPGEATGYVEDVTLLGSNLDEFDGNCHADRVDIWVNLDSYGGSPWVAGRWKWTGNPECRPDYTNMIWLVITHGQMKGYIPINPSAPKKPNTWAKIANVKRFHRTVATGYYGNKATGWYEKAAVVEFWKHGRVNQFYIEWERD